MQFLLEKVWNKKKLRKLARTQIVSLEKLNKKALKKLEYFDDEKNK